MINFADPGTPTVLEPALMNPSVLSGNVMASIAQHQHQASCTAAVISPILAALINGGGQNKAKDFGKWASKKGKMDKKAKII